MYDDEKTLKELGIEFDPQKLAAQGAGLELLNAISQLSSRRKLLAQLADRLIEVGTRAKVDAGELLPNRINSLGELQATGSAFDTACAKVADSVAMVKTLAKVYQAVNGKTGEQD